jgi:hypothetical protein
VTRAAVIERHRQQREARAALQTLTAHHFAEQREFYRPRRKSLRAGICSRRAGKTRGGNESDVEIAAQTQDGRFLYINETRAEAKRLAWHGARGDGMMSLCRDRGWVDSGMVVVNESELTLRFPAINSWIYLIGVDDDAAIRKALGMPWNRVRWDEAQRIPSKFTTTIIETMLPALLDYQGEFLMTGTAERKMSGLFYDVTRTDSKMRGWEVQRWTMLNNPYWGAPKEINGQWFVIWGAKNEIVSGPHAPAELSKAVTDARHLMGVLGLQELLGGELIAPLDSPIMRRSAFAEWVKEDSNFVYAVNKLRDDELFYAEHRTRADGFIDVPGSLADLPGDWRDYVFSMGVDLGFVDAFAMVMWAWKGTDPTLYEVFSFSQSGLDSNEQNDRMRAVREHVAVGQIVADSGGVGKQVAVGWSKEWIERYQLPITEAKKQHKQTNIQSMNADIVARHVKFRDGGPLIAEMRELQWSTLVDGSGRMVEDPTMANHCCFVAGTLVETETGPRAIETIAVGDMVWTRSGLRRVNDSWITGLRDTWQLTTESGRVIEATANHPIYTQDGFIRLDELIPGSMLCAWGSTDLRSAVSSFDETSTPGSSSALDRVRSVQASGRAANVYNLSVEDEHEYFANGILVHNCDASLYSHVHSYAYRARPEDAKPAAGTQAHYARLAAELEDENDEQFDQPWRRRGLA